MFLFVAALMIDVLCAHLPRDVCQAREDVNQHHVGAARGLYEIDAADLAHAGECQLDCSTGGIG
jgi:hypothetical protein